MKILYYDCFAGISGDMNMAALIDAGVDESHLRSELAKLPLDGYELKVTRDNRKGIFGTHVDVVLTSHHVHDHDHEHHHHHPHRNLADIKSLISSAGYSPRVTELSLRIFQRIADAEAKIHGVSPAEVHFHEVGAVDSIVDIVGAAICLDLLNVDKIVCGPVELGGGFVTCAHGTFPVPAPATVEIVKGMPTRLGTIPHETTTPTGAAILAACADEFTDKPAMTITATGYGIGHRDTDIPNVLRVFLGESADASADTQTMRVIECTIDDMNPELYEYVVELLRKHGAADVFLTQVIMKKSRPGVTITVLCEQSQEDTMTDILLRETTTIGVRTHSVERKILQRAFSTVTTKYGDVRIKTSSYKGNILRSKPEYDDCRRLATKHSIPITEIYKEVEQLLSAVAGQARTADKCITSYCRRCRSSRPTCCRQHFPTYGKYEEHFTICILQLSICNLETVTTPYPPLLRGNSEKIETRTKTNIFPPSIAAQRNRKNRSRFFRRCGQYLPARRS